MHLALEDELAALHRKDGALVFSSCYVANDATLSTLGTKFPGCIIFSDRMNHASMIQGMRHSTAKRVIFEHNNLEDLEQKLAQYPKSVPKIIAFESVYSMCGSIGPIKDICNLAERYGALTFLDEVSTRLPRYTAYKLLNFDSLGPRCRNVWSYRGWRCRTSRFRRIYPGWKDSGAHPPQRHGPR